MHRCFARPPLIAVTLIWSLALGACKRHGHVDLDQELDQVKTELEQTQRKLTAAEATLQTRGDELAALNAALGSIKEQLAAKEQVLAQAEAQRSALQTEIDALKKRDAFLFAEARTLQMQGHSVTALMRYEQFMREFPQSPLAAYATSAIAELSAQADGEARRRQEQFDPKRGERELVRRFQEGLATPQELAPLLKRKTRAQVLALAGPPNQTFNNQTELGYTDKAIDSATGKRGMLIIGFEGGVVSSLRVNYAGRKITP